MSVRKRTRKWMKANQINWLIFRLRGYEELLLWMEKRSHDEDAIGHIESGLFFIQELIETLREKRRF